MAEGLEKSEAVYKTTSFARSACRERRGRDGEAFSRALLEEKPTVVTESLPAHNAERCDKIR